MTDVTATIERGSATAPVKPPADAPAKPTRPRRGGFLSSSNGKKAVMAVTGAVMVLFLVGHMAGNLKSFFGAESFNSYAAFLRTMGEPILPHRVLLTVVEIGLVVAVGLHMWAAISLARRARKARPVRYAARRRSRAGGYAVHTMRYGGVVIVLFVVYHLLDLTFGAVNPAGPAPPRTSDWSRASRRPAGGSPCSTCSRSSWSACTCATVCGAPSRRSAWRAVAATAR